MLVATGWTKADLPKARIAAAVACSVGWLLCSVNIAAAQAVAGAPGQLTPPTVPAPGYFAAVAMYNTGQFREAAAALSQLFQPPKHVWQNSYRSSLAGLSDPRMLQWRAARAAANLPIDDIYYFT